MFTAGQAGFSEFKFVAQKEWFCRKNNFAEKIMILYKTIKILD
jgi:hypothetical protein